ncbi:MAG TPA: hypothetical protein VFU33_02950 [Gaiellaceae bacterium]|nr:hypothetical protein [Gaiellaceae bacterium]
MEDTSRIDQAERLLRDRGRQIGAVRVAAGRSGVVLGFPRDPMVHVSWIALAAISGLFAALRLRRER